MVFQSPFTGQGMTLSLHPSLPLRRRWLARSWRSTPGSSWSQSARRDFWRSTCPLCFHLLNKGNLRPDATVKTNEHIVTPCTKSIVDIWFLEYVYFHLLCAKQTKTPRFKGNRFYCWKLCPFFSVGLRNWKFQVAWDPNGLIPFFCL